MKQKKLLALIGSVCLILVLASLPFMGACAKPAPPAPPAPVPAPVPAPAPAPEPIELKFATFVPDTDVSATGFVTPMCQEIERRTEGKVKFTIYWASALGKAQDLFTIVRDGTADMAFFAGSWVPGKFDLSEVSTLPFAAESEFNLVKALTTMTEEGYFDAQPGNLEVEVLGWAAPDPYCFLFRKEKPLKFEDLAGLNARTPGGRLTNYLEAINMVPIKILPADAFTSWEKGLVDVWVHAVGAYVKYSFCDVDNRALLVVNIMTVANGPIAFNKDKLASLPPDIQKVIREVVKEYQPMYSEAQERGRAEAIELMKEKGVEIYTFPASEMEKMKEAAIPIWEEYITDMEALGLPGREIVTEFVRILRQLGEEPAYSP